MWQVSPGQSLRHRGWDDEFVLYNDLSGDTHLLGADALALLLALRQGPAGAAALTAALAGGPGQSNQADTAALLAQLAALSLVEALPC